MMDMYARVHSVESFGCDDGWGIRYIVFLANCGMRCSYCANIDVACGRFTKLMKPQDVINEMNRSREFYIQNKGGLTLSGGECLLHMDWCIETAKLAKENGYTVAIDTCGDCPSKDLSKLPTLLQYVDLVLMDFKAFDSKRHIMLTGKNNDGIINVMNLITESGVETWIRHVVINGTNTDKSGDEDFINICRYIARNLTTVTQLDLLPFHNMAQSKWEEMKLEYKHSDDSVPTEEQMIHRLEVAKELFTLYGRNIVVTR